MPPDSLHTLVTHRTDFSRSAARRKESALRALAASPPTDAVKVRALHDALLFIAAYPDDKSVRRLADDCLRSVGRSIVQSRMLVRRLANSGILGTTTTHEYSLAISTWLAYAFGKEVEIDWSDDGAIDRLESFLPQLGLASERDGLYAEHLTTREWVDVARGRNTGLLWLVQRCHWLSCSPVVAEHLFESLGLAVRWHLKRPTASRTLARFPPRPAFFQRESIAKQVDLRSLLDRPLPPSPKLSRAGMENLLNTCRITLCTRGREIDTLTYVNSGEVYYHRLERGIDVAVFGMNPLWRLPIESYFGFVAARNRVPVAYGGGWVLFDRCEIGVNIFDEFRGGESAFTFAQVLRVYRQLFRSTRFYVDPFQFGADNPEAIRSGAFWFYHRLGFRPTDAVLQRLAAEEYRRIAAQRGYRSPPNVLRRFANGKLLLDLSQPLEADLTHASPADRFQGVVAQNDLDLTALSLSTTRWIGRLSERERLEFGFESETRIRRILGLRFTGDWTGFELIWFARLSQLLRPIESEVRSWPLKVRRAIAEAFRAKGGPCERRYANRLAAITPLHDAWRTLAANAPKPERPALRRPR